MLGLDASQCSQSVIQAYADLRDIVLDAYELGWRRRAGEVTEIDAKINESDDQRAAASRAEAYCGKEARQTNAKG